MFLKEISPGCSLEGLMLKLKLQYFGHLMRRADSFEKDPDAGKDWRQEKKGTTEDEMVGWHHKLNAHEFQQTPGNSEGQGSLASCSPWESQRVRQDWVTERQYTIGETVNCCSRYGNSMEASQKTNNRIPYDPVILLLDIYLKKTKTLIWKDTCTPTITWSLFRKTNVWK